jgi:TolA-binding protein
MRPILVLGADFLNMRAALALVFLLVALTAAPLRADIILSSTGLNNTLKTMERLQRQMTGGAESERAEALFALATEADALAALLNDEVAAHGSQEKLLIDLAVSRTGELGVALAYNRDKKKFFYDNAGFRDYVATFPRGQRAAEALFKVLEGEFFQSSQADTAAVGASADRKAAFLARYPSFPRNSEVSLMLSIDYRDLYRSYQESGDARARDKYLVLTRRQLRATSRKYPQTDEARIAAELLRRFDAERAARR